jgi:murein DD-endopeptidase MepM/ murein hydrolase activator NlpD
MVSTGGGTLSLRTTASAGSAKRGTAANGSRLALACRVSGQLIHGTVRTTVWWDRLTTGAYVSDGYIRRAGEPGICAAPPVSTPPPAPVPGGWMAPVTAKVGDGFRTPARPTHQGVDLRAARNTPIHATAAGTVITVKCNASTNNCDVDGGMSVAGCGWYVEIAHAGKVVTRYCHMGHKPSVTLGQTVVEGQLLGLVGASGHATGPHLHFEVHVGAPPTTSANAVDPVAYMRSKGAPLG